MSDNTSHWWKGLSYLPLDLLIAAGVWMLYMHTHNAIDDKLKNYIDVVRYERERAEHKDWGENKTKEIDDRITKVELYNHGIREKIDKLATDVAIMTTQVQELVKKMDQVIAVNTKPK